MFQLFVFTLAYHHYCQLIFRCQALYGKLLYHQLSDYLSNWFIASSNKGHFPLFPCQQYFKQFLVLVCYSCKPLQEILHLGSVSEGSLLSQKKSSMGFIYECCKLDRVGVVLADFQVIQLEACLGQLIKCLEVVKLCMRSGKPYQQFGFATLVGCLKDREGFSSRALHGQTCSWYQIYMHQFFHKGCI